LEKKLGQLTVKEWLVKAGQSEKVQTRFWDMLSVATLNEEPDVAAATLLAKVLRQGFGGSRTDSCMAVSSVGLSELYTEQARSFIEERGGKISLRTSAKRLLFADDICTGIELANGETVKADIYISAVPYFALRQFLPEKLVSSNQYFAAWQTFKSSPIISIYLWFDQTITDLQFAGLLHARLQWLFNKNLIISSSKRDRQLLTFVISAAHKFQNFSKQQLIDIALEDLYKFIPAAKNAKLLKSLVIKEQHATHSATVESEKHRPEQKSPIKNLLLAGDWTKTGLPATIEGAVLSGRICADIADNL
jgi:squalene-associated FAD-dependent desaturase